MVPSPVAVRQLGEGPVVSIVSMPLTNSAYGFPRGAVRSHTPHILAVVHITGNANNQGANAAVNERNYANRAHSPGPSAHYYLNRDGSGIAAIDHVKYAAWSNGDLNKPRTANAGVATIVKHHAAGKNANECCWLEIENVGTATVSGQITPAQVATMAKLIADESKRTGIPINRNTVLAHADIDTVNRSNCPALPTKREALLSQIIKAANALNAPTREQVTIVITGDKPVNVTASGTLVTAKGTHLVSNTTRKDV